ncbi:hypothetical protein [Algoriphagus limi]|uniref:Anti-sigma factor n=1 Tax=Algoriphagus limi TaxID=2975273 RepID=A0ABT2G7Z5_9BACT|nr:hypothetical protein [Algoriphagus limi]MCS5491379.1 hypothetical protein [Algoriphagus limi]
MENEDDLIKGFFKDLKRQDESLSIPKFPETKVKSFPWWIPMGIAASFILGAFLLFQRPEVPEAPADVIIISLQENENHEQEILIEEKAYIDIWESSTSSLLTEF